MVIGKIGKILLTDVAKTSKLCENPFCVAKQALPKLESLRLAPLSADVAEFSKVKYSTDEIIKAYGEYAKSTKCASITSHYDEGGTLVFGNMPDNYLKKTIEFIPEETVIARFGPNKGKTKTIPAHEDITQYLLPHYHIDKLWTGGKGTGTAAIQDVVRKSLNDPRTNGRVTLFACSIDANKTSPAGFYYKLGFRFKDQKLNENLEKWLFEGGLRENSPFYTGIMYLPKENIEQCLNYVPRH